jgi:guanine deaminase
LATRNLTFYRATILNPKSDTECDFWADGVLVIKKNSQGLHKIFDILDYRKACEQYVEDFGTSNLFEYPQSVIIPAFFDMHFHWVQDDVRLMPKDSLLEWLQKYTFPTEAKFQNKTFAKARAKKFFKKLVSVGTLGGACFSSVHEHALESAMKEAVGDILIGNVLMTMNSPENLQQTPKAAQSLAIKAMKKFKHKYVLTPRFAISTDPETMKKTSQFADQRKIFKQSHLSETKNEIKFVMDLYKNKEGFKKVKNYTEIYHKVGMLGERSLMGHAIHLSPNEIKLLKKTKTNLVHCPTSNAPLRTKGLGSGLFDFKKIEKAGIPWALGSDIGGGPFLSMLDVMHSFVSQHQKVGNKKATYIKALYRSTLAGAQILKVDHRTGSLDKNKEANFIVLKAPAHKLKEPNAVLKKLITGVKSRQAFDKQVTATYWQGKKQEF